MKVCFLIFLIKIIMIIFILFFIFVLYSRITMSEDEVKVFITENPSHPRSSKLISELPQNKKGELILSLIQDAAFCDSWEAYFDFSFDANLQLHSDVAFEAVQAVGGDPMSAQLWILAASICDTDSDAREIYQLGLSVPLFEWDLLFASYVNFEEEKNNVSGIHNPFPDIRDEKWPDRYIFPETNEAQAELFEEWRTLLERLMDELNTGMLDKQIQYRRIDIAFRQMCTQLRKLDVCYFQYAWYQAAELHDLESAISTLKFGIEKVGKESFGLKNLLHVLEADSAEELFETLEQNTLACMRRVAEDALSTGISKDVTRQLRALGKSAAGRAVCDWKIYSQWFQAEHLVFNDSRMAAKVLENGSICCAASLNDFILLSNEALEHHCIRRNETETRASSEQLLQVSKRSKDQGKSLESWNTLSKIERNLGIFSGAEERRQKEFSGRVYLDAFLDKYRVGTLSPCSANACQWIKFLRDYKNSWNREHNSLYSDRISSDRAAISFRQLNTPLESPPVLPELESWDDFDCCGHVAIPEVENSDEVFGPRSYRGRLIYHIQLDEGTTARIKREAKLRAAKKVDVLSSQRDSPIHRLAQKLKMIRWGSEHSRLEAMISFSWLRAVLSNELNLQVRKSTVGAS